MILDRGRILRCLPLALFGFLANLAPLELFLGAKLYFGGLFGLAAMALCGPRLGALAMAFAGLGAGLRGDFGFALLALAEALALAAALESPRWRFYGLVILDSAFWLAFGVWSAFSLRILVGRSGNQAVLDAAVLGTGGMTLAAFIGALRLLASHYAGRPAPRGEPAGSRPRLQRLLADILGDDRRAFRLVLVELGLFIAFVPLFGVLILSSGYNERRVEDEIRAKLEVTARSFEMVSDTWRAEKEMELARLEESATLVLSSGRGAGLEKQLAGKLRSRPELAAMGVLDKDGILRFGKADPSRRPADRIGEPFPDREVLARASEGRSSAFELVADAAGMPLLLIVRPFSAGSAAGAFAYSVIATDTLAEILRGIAGPGGAGGILVDPRGRVAATSDGGLRAIRPYLPRAGYFPIGSAGRSGLRDEGAGFSLDYELGVDSAWRLVLEAPIAPYAEALTAYGKRITILTLLCYVVVILATAWASRLIVFSLEALRRSALRFTDNAERPELVSWPDSRLLEVASLSQALKTASLLLDKRYRELEAARDEAERANRAKERLLASVSHDIRGPVGGIVNMAESLEAEVERPELREYATLIKETGTGLHLLLDELLDRSAMDAGAFELRPAPFDLLAAVGKAAKGFGVAAAAKGLGYAWEADGSLPAAVLGDRRRLDQILGNLVGNALKYTAAGSISFAVRDEGRRGDRRLVRFEVGDSGPGMTPEELDRVFDPYWRGSSQAGGIAGSGLGLAIVKDLVTKMGGRIGAVSEPGKGSVFTVVLPFEEPAGTKPSAGRILVADDERINRVFARRTFEKAGHAVAEATDGRAAVAAAVAEDYDLVILDLVMPGLDGPAAAKAIRDARGPARPRIVALSARALSAGERRELLETGFDALLRKPVSAEDLLAEADFGTREAPPADGSMAELLAGGAAAGEDGRIGGDPVDLDGLLAAYHGDEAFRRNLLEILLADGSRRLAELRNLAPERNEARYMELVHSLVNILGTAKASRAYAAFLALEAALRGDLVEDKERLRASALEEADRALAFTRTRLAEGPGGD